MLMTTSDPREGLKKQSGRMTIDGVLFESWRTGILRSKWVSEDGRVELFHYISRHGGTTCQAAVDGQYLGKKFRSYKTAARAALAQIKRTATPRAARP